MRRGWLVLAALVGASTLAGCGGGASTQVPGAFAAPAFGRAERALARRLRVTRVAGLLVTSSGVFTAGRHGVIGASGTGARLVYRGVRYRGSFIVRTFGGVPAPAPRSERPPFPVPAGTPGAILRRIWRRSGQRRFVPSSMVLAAGVGWVVTGRLSGRYELFGARPDGSDVRPY